MDSSEYECSNLLEDCCAVSQLSTTESIQPSSMSELSSDSETYDSDNVTLNHMNHDSDNRLLFVPDVDSYNSDEESDTRESLAQNCDVDSDIHDVDFDESGSCESHCFEPLYDGSHVSRIEAMLLIFQFALKYNVTDTALDDLLKMVYMLLPQPNKCLRSLYQLKKMIKILIPHLSTNRHKYCSFCNVPVEDSHQSCHGNKYVTHFITTDLEEQLKEKFKDKEFWYILNKRPTPIPDVLCDVYDGMGYSVHRQPGGFLCPQIHPANISFTFNTDGVSLFRSSQTGIWPLYLAINELPPAEQYICHKSKVSQSLYVCRFSIKHVLLCGLWYSKEKPNMHTYLRPLIDAINKIYHKGVVVSTPDGIYCCRGMLLICTVDLPAKALVCNMKGFSGEYSCSTCLDKGDNTIGLSHLHRYWPFNHQCEIRSTDDVCAVFTKASETGQPEMGYKGFPILALHQPFHLVDGVVVDYLHCVLLGVVKMLMKFWFTTTNRNKPYYIGKKVKMCDERLLNINVPDIIKRKPRTINDCGHWKGNELQAWLLWYSLPVLKGILPEPYLQHYVCLVVAIELLLEAKVTRESLHRADILLNEFCSKMTDLYGSSSNRMNVHLLQHLTYHVKNWGPLWSFSCFSFESLNGELKKYYHGTRNMNDQLMFTFMMVQSLPRLIQDIKCIKLFEKRKGFQTKQYSQDMWHVGNGHPYRDFEGLHIDLGFTPVTVVNFYRLQIGRSIYYSSEYKRTTKTNNFTVMYKHPGVTEFKLATINFFLEVEDPSSHECKVFAVIQHLNTETFLVNGELIPHMWSVLSMEISCIPVEWIFKKCILIQSCSSGDIVVKIFDHCNLSV